MHEGRRRPTYDLDEVKQLAARKQMRINGRITGFLRNRYGIARPATFISDLIASVSADDFYKSEAMRHIPGVWADIYRHVKFDDEEWYIKFFIDRDGTVALSVLSATWEYYIH